MTVTPLPSQRNSGGAPGGGPVVVGVSPSTGSPQALQWAAEYARTYGLGVRAVLAWRAPRPPGVPGGHPPVSAVSTATIDHARVAETELRDFVGDVLDGVENTELRAVKGAAVSALLKASADAELLV